MSKRTKKICIILIISLIVLTIGEILIRAIINKINSVIEEEEERKQAEIIYNSDEQVTKRQIITFLNDIFSAVNSENYDFIFDSMKEEYRKYMFNDDIEQLKKYVKDNIDIGDRFEYPRIVEKNGLYQVLVSITNQDMVYSQEMTVDVLGKNECNFMFGTYNSFQENIKKWNSEKMAYTLLYTYETPELIGYVVDIKNNSDGEISINFHKKPQLILSNGKVFEGASMDTLVVKPTEIKRVECFFNKIDGGQATLKIFAIENSGDKDDVFYILDEDNM